MFVAALFTIAKTCKQPKRPTTDEWIKKNIYIYIYMEIGEGNGNPLLPGRSHGRRSLVGCSPWGCEESDTTEQLPFHFSFSCIGEGNGSPLQCSCLENPRDRGAWWAAVYGVTQSRTRLKRLSSIYGNIIVCLA